MYINFIRVGGRQQGGGGEGKAKILLAGLTKFILIFFFQNQKARGRLKFLYLYPFVFTLFFLKEIKRVLPYSLILGKKQECLKDLN